MSDSIGAVVAGILVCISCGLVIFGIYECFDNGIAYLNEAEEYQSKIDELILTDCKLKGYNASICDVAMTADVDYCVGGVQYSTEFCVGYAYVYQSIARGYCNDEILFIHPDDLECGWGNSALQYTIDDTFKCMAKCEDNLFYLGQDLSEWEELRQENWSQGFWYIFGAAALICCFPCCVALTAFCIAGCDDGW